MALEILRVGSKGPLVEAVQTFLRGKDLYEGVVDGDFGSRTRAAVIDWQRARALEADGVVGNITWGSLMVAGLVVLPPDDPEDDERGANWPPKPVGLKSLTAAQRQQIFGELAVEPDPIAGSPENCKIIRKGPAYRIVEVELPLLVGVPGFVGSKTLFHAKGARQLQLLIRAWDDAGLLDRVLSWGGALAVRYVRGSKTTLSSHGHGTAFDINVPQNGLGRQPALAGRHGSVRELVEIANDLGFFWGGHYNQRPDGQHFELGEVQ